MESWKNQRRGENQWHEGPRRRSQYRKPHQATWQPTVPAWEKQFCKVVGSMNWGAFMQAKKFIHVYDNILKWDDSAGEEAFHNAKERFWAEINNLPSDIALPDPDLYIDKVDYDAVIDLELVRDLERTDSDEQHEPVVIFGDSLIANQSFSATGWGDAEETIVQPTQSSPVDHIAPMEHNQPSAYQDGVAPAVGWNGFYNTGWQVGDGGAGAGYVALVGDWNNSWDWNNSNYYYSYEAQPQNFNYYGAGNQGSWGVNNSVQVNASAYNPRYNTSRFQGNDRNRNHASRNVRGSQRGTYAGQSSTRGGRGGRGGPSINSCAPVNQVAWSWEKTIS